MQIPKLSITDIEQLEQMLASPNPSAIEALSRVPGDILVLGAGGKMGPSLTRMLRAASIQAGTPRRIVAVSRFTSPSLQNTLEAEGIETLKADLLSEDTLGTLPEAPNVVFMTGSKFGTKNDASQTWAMNVILPAMVCRRFSTSRMLVFSTGNVYPFVQPKSGGSRESDPLNPVGEYGMSAVGRERVFEYYSRLHQIPVSIVRLNYAVEMRYGVLVDLAKQIKAGDEVELSMGHANVIWQGDANSMAIAALADASVGPYVVNVAGREIFSVEDVCRQLARKMDVPVNFRGTPAGRALLSDASIATQQYGPSRVDLDQLIQWTADWLRRDMPTWQKPTHFEVRDGQF